MVATGGAIKSAQGKTGRDHAGRQDKSEREGNAVGNGRGYIWGRQAIGCICGYSDRQCPGGRRNSCCGGGRCISIGWGGSERIPGAGGN